MVSSQLVMTGNASKPEQEAAETLTVTEQNIKCTKLYFIPSLHLYLSFTEDSSNRPWRPPCRSTYAKTLNNSLSSPESLSEIMVT